MATYDNIIAKIKQVIPNLNPSNAGIMARTSQIMATEIDIVRLEMARSENIIDTVARAGRVLNKQWYIEKSLAFQYGDTLVVVDPATQAEGYATIDASKQIVRQVAISTPDNGVIYLKVAKQNSSKDALTQLTVEELREFIDYIRHFIALGITITPTSGVPDVLKAQRLYVRYNPSFPLNQIKTAINRVLVDYQFVLHGETPIFVNDIEEIVESVEGVVNAYFVGISIESSESPTSLAPTDGIIVSPAGYFNFDTTLTVDDENSVIVYQATNEVS